MPHAQTVLDSLMADAGRWQGVCSTPNGAILLKNVVVCYFSLLMVSIHLRSLFTSQYEPQRKANKEVS